MIGRRYETTTNQSEKLFRQNRQTAIATTQLISNIIFLRSNNEKSPIFLVLCISFNAAAVEKTPVGKITGYYTGWNQDQVRVTIEGADYTEGNCDTKDGYVTADSDNSGYKTHISALLAAYMAGKPVRLVIEGCLNSRPKILGVYMEN